MHPVRKLGTGRVMSTAATLRDSGVRSVAADAPEADDLTVGVMA